MHYQIYVQLRAEIKDGLWIDRRDFPGEADLAERFGVSVITSRKSLERLASEGWIDRGRGRKTVARALPSPRSAPPASEILPTGRARPFVYTVLSREVAIAPAEACIALGAKPGASLWQCSRLRRFEGRPHSVTLNVQQPEIGSTHSLADLRTQPMSRILRHAGFRLATLTRQVGATLPPPSVAGPLGITLNDPTLVFTFAILDEQDKVIEWVRIFVHPNEPNPYETMDLRKGTWTTDVAM
jgi:GntR family transcriptional regulator